MAIEITKEDVSKGVEDIDLDLLLNAVFTLKPQVRALVKSRRLFS